jgi:hypothetical protein
LVKFETVPLAPESFFGVKGTVGINKTSNGLTPAALKRKRYVGAGSKTVTFRSVKVK